MNADPQGSMSEEERMAAEWAAALEESKSGGQVASEVARWALERVMGFSSSRSGIVRRGGPAR